ncbi:23S rRNA (Adenine(2503)-C(2))-methyltransferase @ tRNA (Adenine(37)-C(2))-methyltransferase [Streptomyces misionensis JCM 4497]
MDGHSGRLTGEAARGAVPGADDRRPASVDRRGHHPQDAVEAVRRHPRGVRADAVPGPGDHVHQLAGGVRDELPVLRDRAGGAGPEPVHRGDRPPDRGRDARAARRGGARRARAAVQHRLHGDGGAARQLQAGRRSHPRAHRSGAGRARAVAARDHRLHRRAGAGHPPVRRRGLQVPAGHLAARPRRRAARHPGPREHAVEGARGAGRRVRVRREERAPAVDRVRAHPRHQRPGLARRPARPAAQGPARACEPHSAEPHSGLEVDRLPAGGREGLRRGDRRARCARHHPGHPRTGDRRGVWSARGHRAVIWARSITSSYSDRGAPQR